MANTKFVYMFTETDETMRNLVGGKGANLGQMTKLGLPIPRVLPSPPRLALIITITTASCRKRSSNKSRQR